jgi:hypothetical protein
LSAYALMFQGKGYIYADHYSLPDIFQNGSNKKVGISGQYTIDLAKSLGINFKRIDLPNRDDSIRCAQDFVNVCHFSKKAQEGIEGLKDWRRRKNDALSTPDKPVYFDEPVKSWGRHAGDAYCGAAVAYRCMSLGGIRRGKLSIVLPKKENQMAYDNDVLTRGLRRVG